MAKLGINRLSAKKVEAFRGPGRICDGGGLYWDGRNWAFLYSIGGRRREMGLGSVSLAAARDLAKDYRDMIATGEDPIASRRAKRSAGVTFKEVADDAREIASKKWTTEDATVRWNRAVDRDCKSICSTAMREVSIDDVERVLKGITAITQRRFVQGVMSKVFKLAIAKRLRTDNPADVDVIGTLVSLSHKTTHQPALKWGDVPAYVAGTRALQGDAARCIELLIRTGVRRREATEARFDEIDMDNAIWHIPPSRTKQRRAHDVPLTDAALAIIRQQRERYPKATHVFPGSVGSPHLSPAALNYLSPEGATVHGFRSALRDYLGDCTSVAFETAEECLGHRISRDPTVHAYRRSSGLAKRREALELWNNFIDGLHENGKDAGNVLQFKEAQAAS